jgi:hypothetical protein
VDKNAKKETKRKKDTKRTNKVVGLPSALSGACTDPLTTNFATALAGNTTRTLVNSPSRGLYHKFPLVPYALNQCDPETNLAE